MIGDLILLGVVLWSGYTWGHSDKTGVYGGLDIAERLRKRRELIMRSYKS